MGVTLPLSLHSGNPCTCPSIRCAHRPPSCPPACSACNAAFATVPQCRGATQVPGSLLLLAQRNRSQPETRRCDSDGCIWLVLCAVSVHQRLGSNSALCSSLVRCRLITIRLFANPSRMRSPRYTADAYYFEVVQLVRRGVLQAMLCLRLAMRILSQPPPLDICVWTIRQI